jgi:hypothetical protein
MDIRAELSGAKAAMDVELPPCDIESAWRILWALYGDDGLKPDDVETACDGLAGEFAHVRWSAYATKDLLLVAVSECTVSGDHRAPRRELTMAASGGNQHRINRAQQRTGRRGGRLPDA